LSFDIKLSSRQRKYGHQVPILFKSESMLYSILAAEMSQLQYEVRLKRMYGAVQISELRALGLNNHRLAFGSYSTYF